MGEGFGGALALVTAALLPGEVRCAALNPMPADFRRRNGVSDEKLLSALDYMDPVNFAPFLRGALLMGTGLMDKVAPPEGAVRHLQPGSLPQAAPGLSQVRT